jgi:HSP90 family molecular chaperone
MKLMQGPDDAMPAPTVKLQINPRHAIIKGLFDLYQKDEPTGLLVANQLVDNAMASANLVDDPREMISRNFQLLEKITAQG